MNDDFEEELYEEEPEIEPCWIDGLPTPTARECAEYDLIDYYYELEQEEMYG